MKRLILLFTLLSSPLFAQSLPNRQREVDLLVTAKYQMMLNGDENRRREVLGQLCGDLNILDGNQWGLLIKNDRNPPFIPSDILVWLPTREHVDVLTDNGSTWIRHEAIPSQWSWLVCPVVVPPPVGEPTPVPIPVPGPIFDTEVLRRLTVIEQKQDLTMAAIEDAKLTITDFLKGFAKYVSPALITAIVTWILARDPNSPAP